MALALALASATIFEFRSALSLIAENRQLLTQQINRMFQQAVDAQFEQVPTHLNDVLVNWQSLGTEFVLWQGSEQVYPKSLITKQSEHPLWQQYTNPSSDSSNERIQILRRLKQALENDSTGEITKASQDFILHLSNFRLSWQEELISRLGFLNVKNDVKWNPQLIDLLLFSGNEQLKPAVYFLFFAANTPSEVDYQKALETMGKIVEATPMSTQVLNNYAAQVDSTYELPKVGYWITASGFSKRNVEHARLVPIDSHDYLQRFSNDLVSLGLLEEQDKVVFNVKLPIELNESVLVIQRQVWLESEHNAWLALIVKLVFLLLISLILLAALKAYRKQAQAELSALNAKEQFIQFVGHELKTPLASIRLMAETLYKRQQAGLPNKDYPQRIVDESDKLEFMVENLLSLQHLQSSEALTLEPISLRGIVEQELSLLSAKTTKRINFTYDTGSNSDADLDLLSSDRYLPLVIRNLFDNAAKYCDAEEIRLSCLYDKNKRTFVVEDNGIGLKDIESIFQPFAQGKGAKQGFGLGLALSKVIMNRLGGDIKVAKTGPEGTRWILLFGDQID